MNFEPKHWWSVAAGVMSFITTAFVLLILKDTLLWNSNLTVDPPIGIAAWNNGIGLVVVYERGFTIIEDGDGAVQRIVRCPPHGEDKYYLEGETIHKHFKAGKYPASKRPVQFPVPLPVGTECVLETWGIWRPRFSISNKRFLLDEIRFTVADRAPQ